MYHTKVPKGAAGKHLTEIGASVLSDDPQSKKSNFIKRGLKQMFQRTDIVEEKDKEIQDVQDYMEKLYNDMDVQMIKVWARGEDTDVIQAIDIKELASISKIIKDVIPPDDSISSSSATAPVASTSSGSSSHVLETTNCQSE
ncbi:hypothetical protein D9758_010084 [Tetrapyrgos nigripes]|uniref:Uncharacterized protein n=1 Tax=Tetrapyrgos nigripes TaxID=182062 RepID=A0A8H5FSD4_9AGAR|nr:hypothetical protein D9758_010084 [Tetrapyrgos nigripes]